MSTNSSAMPAAVQVRGLVELYTAALRRRGYRPIAIAAYQGAVEHFLAWAAPDVDFVEFGEFPIRRFIDEHLPACGCTGRRQRGKVTALSALRHLLTILRSAGLVPPAPPNFPHFINTELETYCDYAAGVGGLAPATLISRRQWIGRFLAYSFPAGDFVFSRLGPEEIRGLFTTQCQGYQPGTAQVVASSIRSYLRFRAVRHADPVEAAAAAVPSAACWRLASLPEHLGQAELTKI